MQLHLVTVAFEPRIKQVYFQLVYDPEAKQVAYVSYTDPRVLGRMERADRMQEKLAALTPADLDALRAAIGDLRGEVLGVETRRYTDFVAQYYYRGAPVWLEDWTPDDDDANARVMAQAATLEATLTEVEAAAEAGEPDVDLPRLAIRVLPNGQLQVSHNLVGVRFQATIVREDDPDSAAPLVQHGVLDGDPEAVAELRNPAPTPRPAAERSVPAMPAPRPEPA